VKITITIMIIVFEEKKNNNKKQAPPDKNEGDRDSDVVSHCLPTRALLYIKQIFSIFSGRRSSSTTYIST
jgi:hypothetical protein